MTTVTAENVINLNALDCETADAITAYLLHIREIKREIASCEAAEKDDRARLGEIVGNLGAAVQVEGLALVRFNAATTTTTWNPKALQELLDELTHANSKYAARLVKCKRQQIREAHTQVTFAKEAK